jgi:hypothetical protein
MYTESTQILAALRTQTRDAIDEAYLTNIPNADADYELESLPPKVILDYVCTNYGRTTNVEYEANRNRVRAVADHTKPIAEMLVTSSQHLQHDTVWRTHPSDHTRT